MEREQAEGGVCNRRREKGDIEAPQAVIQLERVRGEGYRIVQCSRPEELIEKVEREDMNNSNNKVHVW